MVVAGLAYVSVAIGGYQHRSELNAASYSIWLILSTMLAYSAKKQGLPCFHMLMTWVAGNAFMVVFSLAVGGYTFNLGVSEAVAFYGIVIVLAVWATAAAVTGKWNSRILFLGALGSDIASFYPQLKQYLLPHDPATNWMYIGWILWIIGSLAQLIYVDEFMLKWSAKAKPRLTLIEESAASLENSILLIITTLVMMK